MHEAMGDAMDHRANSRAAATTAMAAPGRAEADDSM